MTRTRIAMWSGPRNLSTAMMRSWENRLDTEVLDEPLYAHYLAVTMVPEGATGTVELRGYMGSDHRGVLARIALR